MKRFRVSIEEVVTSDYAAIGDTAEKLDLQQCAMASNYRAADLGRYNKPDKKMWRWPYLGLVEGLWPRFRGERRWKVTHGGLLSRAIRRQNGTMVQERAVRSSGDEITGWSYSMSSGVYGRGLSLELKKRLSKHAGVW